jgi:hypothetical protein
MTQSINKNINDELSTIVYVVGTYIVDRKWMIEGIFYNKDVAIKNCTNKNMFVGPIEINKLLPAGINAWPGCFYPMCENIEDQYTAIQTCNHYRNNECKFFTGCPKCTGIDEKCLGYITTGELGNISTLHTYP